MSRLVVDMQDVRSIWSLPEWTVREIREALPPSWEVVVMETPADGSGDGATRVDPRTLESVRDAEVYLGFGIPAEILRAGTSLRWVHSGAAGVGGSLTPEMLASEVVFTNSAGIHGPPMAETVVAMILHFARGLDFAVRAQARTEWWKEPFYRGDTPVREVAGSTVGILGYGGIGREVARRVLALGARVLALRSPGGGPEGSGDGVTVLRGESGLDRLLAESDYLVVSAPETPRTRGIVGREALARLKEGAVLLNVSRGALVDEDALVDALREGRLRGAGLDVFRREPLPRDHPLWGLDGVLVTPHVSAVSRGFWRRETDLIVENVGRFLSGDELLNVVDKQAGY